MVSVLLLISLFLGEVENQQDLKSDSLIIKELESLNKITRDKAFHSTLDSTLLYGREGITLALKAKDTLSLAKFYSSFGTVYRRFNKTDSSQYFFEKSARLYEALKDYTWAGYMYNNIAVIYKDGLEYEKAIKHVQKAVDMRLLTNDHMEITSSYRLLGYLNERMNNFEAALEWDWKAMNLSRKNNDEAGIAYANIYIGDVYDRLQIYDSALFYRFEAVKLYSKLGDKIGEAITRGSIGRTYYNMGNYQEALSYTYQHLNHVANIGYSKETAKANVNLGMILSQLGQDSLAIEHIEKGIELSNSIDYTEQELEAFHRLYELYAQQGDSLNAYTYLYKYTMLNDSIFNLERANMIETIQTEFDVRLKKQEVDLLMAEAEVNDLKLKQANNQVLFIILGSVFIILLLIGIYIWKSWRENINNAREKEILQKQRFESVINAEERERKRIAGELHDGLGQLLSTAKLNISALEDESLVEQPKPLTNSMKLIDQAVSEVRTISHNMMPNALISIGLVAALKEQVHLINDSKQLLVHETLPEDLDLSETKSIALYRIIQEIMNNALKYAKANNIWLDFIKQANALTISIKDDGIGFDIAKLNSNTGIGWQNIYSRMDILNGDIKVNSTKGKGTKVVLKLTL